MWNFIKWILDRGNVANWPARFQSLHWTKQLCVLVAMVIGLVSVLILLGDVFKVGVSIGGKDPTLVRLSNQIVVALVLAAVVLIVISLLFMVTSDPAKSAASHDAKTIPVSYPSKLRVHVVLPTGPVGKSLGDGLLQAAGFLAARDAFANGLSIIPHDHHNDAGRAAQIFADILAQEIGGTDPICLVYTMSNVCQAVAEKVQLAVQHNSTLADRLSVVFTVASAPDTPHNGEFLFQHFVRGDQEAKEIVQFCRQHTMTHRITNPDVLFLSMQSPYSQQTVRDMLTRLVMNNNFRAQNISISKDGKLLGRQAKDIREWRERASEESVAISVSYDRSLLGAIRALHEADFHGPFVATTTLSVLDWQEYLKSNGYLNADGFRMWHTCVEGFDPDAGPARQFAQRLSPWTLDRVLAQEAYYGEHANIAGRWFDDIERKVYNTILPNYISAFCFDAVRLFSVMREHSARRLADLDLPFNGSREPFLRDCPFEYPKFTKEGRTELPVVITDIPLTDEAGSHA